MRRNVLPHFFRNACDRVTLRARAGDRSAAEEIPRSARGATWGYGLIEAQDDRALGHGIVGIVGALDDA
jgi:hypothetical protein